MNSTYIKYALSAVGGMALAIAMSHPFGWVTYGLGIAYLAGRMHMHAANELLLDRIHWMEQRSDRIGDLTLEREVKRLRRRLAGLLLSPSFYERAHRIVAPLELAPGELTEELEAIQSEGEWKWPDLVFQSPPNGTPAVREVS